MTKIAPLPAGAKRGVRPSSNRQGSLFEMAHVEISEEGRQRLHDAVGTEYVEQDQALANAVVAVVAVSDRLIGPSRTTSSARSVRAPH